MTTPPDPKALLALCDRLLDDISGEDGFEHTPIPQGVGTVARALKSRLEAELRMPEELRERVARIIWDREHPISDEAWAALPEKDVCEYGEWQTGKEDYYKDADAIIAALLHHLSRSGPPAVTRKRLIDVIDCQTNGGLTRECLEAVADAVWALLERPQTGERT